jgi:hypothetical protein
MSLLFALALLAADPTGPAPAGAAAPVATQGQEDPDYLPKGAPADDYAFVAWCDGVLAGHMDLAAHLSDQLPLDDVQQNIGHAYLKAYAKALAMAPENKTEEGKKRAEAARLDGWSKWEAARDTPDKNLAVNTYLAYQLPGRCEHAAERLAHDPHLFRMAPTTESVEAMGVNTVGTQTSRMAAAPAGPAPAPAPVMMTSTPPPAPAAEPVLSQTGQASVQMTETTQAPPPAPAPMPMVTRTAAATPAAKPTQTADIDTGGDHPLVKMPKKGHLLPPFLRSKASKEKEAAEDAAAGTK